MTTLLECALQMAALHWAVFPLEPMGKAPIGGHGFKDAVKDGATIRKWWTQNPRANIGIATGKISGIWVLDADEDYPKGKHGLDDLQALTEAHGALPETRTAFTPRGGMHLYFAYDPARPINNSVSRIAPGLDTRGDGGYVAAPDSQRIEGEYLWVNDAPIVTAPAWLIDLLTAPKRPPHVARQIRLSGAEVDKAIACLDRLSLSRVDNYQQWVEVGMSLYGLGLAGLQLWDDWSHKSPKYKAGECERKWKSFDVNGITFGSLIAWAQQDSPAITKREKLGDILRRL